MANKNIGYAYDPEGLRVVKKAKGETTHYVFQGTEPIFEKKISASKTKSYVYALGKYLARVDGVIGDAEAKKYFYHTDHVGSIRVITDQAGKVVYNADYLAFGSQYTKDGDFEELHGFTGKEYDPDIGLYYYNARWYDPDLGRFISEDPAGQGPNPYSYCGNSPVMRVDPTGEFWWVFALLGGLDSYLCGGDFMQGFVMGAITGAIGAGVGSALSNTAWGAALANSSAMGFNAVSGAIAGGITGELFGEGFGKGAVFGAVAGAINFGVDQRFGDFASKSTFNKLLINGLKGGLNGLARGGDFIEGFAYGFVYGYANELSSLLSELNYSINKMASKNDNTKVSATDVNGNKVIKNAIKALEQTEWGKNNPDTIKRLWELFNKGRIKFDPKLYEKQDAVGRYQPNLGSLKRELISLDSYLLDVSEDLLLTLAHEGTHALDDVKSRLWHGPQIRLSTEYRAIIAEDTLNYELTGKYEFMNLDNKNKYYYLMDNYQIKSSLTYYNDMRWLMGE